MEEIELTKGQSFVIGGVIFVSIEEIRRDRVRIGVTAPWEMPIHRKEVYDVLQECSIRFDTERKLAEVATGKNTCLSKANEALDALRLVLKTLVEFAAIRESVAPPETKAEIAQKISELQASEADLQNLIVRLHEIDLHKISR